eukprot:1139974-Pelagomonas_calceolata.AAC.6
MEIWWSQVGFMLRLIRHVRPDLPDSNPSAANQTSCKSGQGAPIFRPQITPSDIIAKTVKMLA